MRATLFVVSIAALLFAPDRTAWADNPDQATKDQLQLEVDILKLQVEKADNEKKLRDDQAAAATPAAASGFVQRSGAISGGEKFGFAIYLSALRPLEDIAQQMCKDVFTKTGGKSIFVTSQNIPNVTDQWQS
ncbi:MAG TPA: hypothetical protein VMC79_07565, partial [Rectinemataceae bacterium]|nr:hypothetical protein [Rectinemataceae bacterium]